MKTIVRKLRMTLTLALAVVSVNTFAFCGFYVCKADANLFNKKSQVILVRDGDRTVITMSNDYQGDLKEFAMVVPVPTVLKEEQIRIAKQLIFDKLDAYSAPRMAEYYDSSPCQQYYDLAIEEDEMTESVAMSRAVDDNELKKDKLGVTIKAKYTVGEYDIMILSAKQSDGLKTWLTQNGYKLPKGAEEVLEPYIKNNMKFFVAKVNLEKQKKSGFQSLRPLQFAVKTDKFMLPIRLGMANANGHQDLIVYAFTKKGRVETANYRTVKMPSDMTVPVFCQDVFGDFYKAAYKRAWKKESEKAVMLEYAWDLSSTNQVKCDPCVAPALPYADLREAGVFWLNPISNSWNTQGQYSGQLFVTRLHVRYNRQNYPQDLLFTQTPNKERFQCRYVIQHPAGKDLTCDAAQGYYKGVVKRRKQELQELAKLTGWNPTKYQYYVDEYAKLIKKPAGAWIDSDSFGSDASGTIEGPDTDESKATITGAVGNAIDSSMEYLASLIDSTEIGEEDVAAIDPVDGGHGNNGTALLIIGLFAAGTLSIGIAMRKRTKKQSLS